MKQKILSGVALFAALIAFVVSLGALINSVRHGLPNTKVYIIQIIGVSVIFLICVINFIASFHTNEEQEDEDVVIEEEE